MCIISVKPAGEKILLATYEDMFRRNPDGAGIAYVDPIKNTLVIKKGLMTAKELIEEVLPIEHQDLLIHFRVASPGMVINAKNCHPFRAEYFDSEVEGATPRFQFAIAHNGKLDWRDTKDHSDTSCFVHDIMRPHISRDPWFLDQEYGQIMMERMICSVGYTNNKMAVMRYDTVEKKTVFYIINEKAGDTDGKIWYSNKTWKEPKGGWAIAANTAWRSAMELLDGQADEGYYGQVTGHNSHHGGYTPPFIPGAVAGIGKSTHLNNPAAAKVVGPESATGQLVPPMPVRNANATYRQLTGYFELLKLSKPDVNGWFWSFTYSCWMNTTTKIWCEKLLTRMEPYDVDVFMKTGIFMAPVGATKEHKELMELYVAPVVVTPVKAEGPPSPLPKVVGLDTSKINIDHLDKKERQLLVHESVQVMMRGGWKKEQIRDFSVADKIDQLRSHVRFIVEDAKGYDGKPVDLQEMDDTYLDIWMLARIKEGAFRDILIAAENAEFADSLREGINSNDLSDAAKQEALAEAEFKAGNTEMQGQITS